MAEPSRPAKRPRKEMRTADGFQISEWAAKPRSVQVPQFVSTFGQERDMSESGRSGKSASRRKGAERTVATLGMIAGTSASNHATSASLVDEEVRLISGSGEGTSKRNEKEKEQKWMKADLIPHAESLVLGDPTKRKDPPQLRPAPAPMVISISSSSTTAATSSLKQVVPPVLKPPSKSNVKPLQSLQPPVISSSVVSLKGKEKEKDLHSLSTIGFGLGFLQSTQNGAAEELAGILLRDQHPEILLTTREEEERTGENAAKRGLEMSPEKMNGRGTGAKYIRGGLAAEASAFLERSLTTLVLWKKGIQLRPNAFPPDFTCSVVKILHMPLPSRSHSKFSSPLNSTSPGIALCRVQLQNDSSHPSLKASHLHRVVLSFPNNADSNDAMSPAQFMEGRTILVFRPWHEVSFRPVDDHEQDKPPVDLDLRLPASLPLPLSGPYSTPDPLDAPVSDIGLIITHFYIKT